MISTKDLSGLPNAERLKNFCKGLAALDIIMVEEEWSFIRHYTYNPAWRKGKEAFFATDGSDQSMIVLFAPEGCVINGVDSELYDWEEKLPHIEDLIAGMPPALQNLGEAGADRAILSHSPPPLCNLPSAENQRWVSGRRILPAGTDRQQRRLGTAGPGRDPGV